MIQVDRHGFTSGWSDVAGVRTHDRHRCDAAGLPVVLVHGLAMSHRYLMPTARHLAAHLPVLVPDLPGFGHSDKPPIAYDVDRHARHLSVWLDACGLSRVCLVGHSFGTEIAARLAVLRPDTVESLVLAGPTSDPRARTRWRLVRRWLADVPGEAVWQAPILVRDLAEAKPWRLWATVEHSARNAIERDLCRLPVPPLVLGGSRDRIAPAGWRAAVAAYGGGVSVTVPGAAHNVLTTAGARCAALILAHTRAPVG
jgi:pimeloyl-ACP methyl ester carboxylesterase